MDYRTRYLPLLTALRAFNEPKLSGTGRLHSVIGPELNSMPPINNSSETRMHDCEGRYDGRKNPSGPRMAKQDRRTTINLVNGHTAYQSVYKFWPLNFQYSQTPTSVGSRVACERFAPGTRQTLQHRFKVVDARQIEHTQGSDSV